LGPKIPKKPVFFPENARRSLDDVGLAREKFDSVRGV
jgi:hypothetical protein